MGCPLCTLFIPASGRFKVPMSREAALAVKPGQKVWIAERPHFETLPAAPVRLLDICCEDGER